MIFFVPALASGYLLVFLWRSGDLFGLQELLFGAWFVAAVLVQFLAPSTSVWLAGLIAQVALGIVLIMKERMDRIL